jgi:hypothetical protein
MNKRRASVFFRFRKGETEVLKKMKQWWKSDFSGSTIALWIGWLSLISGIPGIAQNPPPKGDNVFLGVVMLLGIYAYRSAKKRTLGTKKNGVLRKATEIGLLLLMLILVSFQRDAVNQIVDHPLSGILAPVWILIAYVVVWIRRRAVGVSP